jgi:hypothetical protein
MLALAVTGCLASYGMVRPSIEIDKMFEAHQILADHRYYIDGSDLKPNAILAVHNDFNLQSKLWRPVTPTKEQLRTWVEEMTRYRGYSFYTYGARMMGPDGQQIGFWYSPYQFTTVQMLGGNEVSIVTPNIPNDPDRRTGFSLP